MKIMALLSAQSSLFFKLLPSLSPTPQLAATEPYRIAFLGSLPPETLVEASRFTEGHVAR